jgi:hypothetical protein
MFNSKPLIMKALKVTLLLAIFCLTFSGQSSDVNTSETTDNYKVNKNEFNLLAEIVKKNKLPGQA